jgi:hypothetical protein
MALKKYITSLGFKKEYPDELEPKFYWFIKDMPHKFLEGLNANINLRKGSENISIWVTCKEFAEQEVCIINKDLVGKTIPEIKALINDILKSFEVNG